MAVFRRPLLRIRLNVPQLLHFGPIILKDPMVILGIGTQKFFHPEVRMPQKIVYLGNKIKVALDWMVMPDQSTVLRDVVVHPGAVAIIPLVDTHHICLVRNQRFILGTTLLEIPAGTLEPGEDPDRAAERELAEETGFRAARWRKLTEIYPSPGILSERTHLYLAEKLTPGATNLDQG